MKKNAFVYLLLWIVLLSVLCLVFAYYMLLNDTGFIQCLSATAGIFSMLSIAFAVKKYSDLKTSKNMQHE